MKHLGQRIRDLRKKNNLFLREVAASLEMDTALMSKIERGERNASRQQVIDMARLLKADVEELLAFWLADKIENTLIEEPDLAYKAMKIANKTFRK